MFLFKFLQVLYNQDEGLEIFFTSACLAGSQPPNYIISFLLPGRCCTTRRRGWRSWSTTMTTRGRRCAFVWAISVLAEVTTGWLPLGEQRHAGWSHTLRCNVAL